MITSENIKEVLQAHVDDKFKDFTSALIPGARPILGVRIPAASCGSNAYGLLPYR